jgi:hypothetical protein
VLMLLVQQQLQQELPQRDCTLHTWGDRRQVRAQNPEPVGWGLRQVVASTPIPDGPLIQELSSCVFVSSFDPETQGSFVILEFATHKPAGDNDTLGMT